MVRCRPPPFRTTRVCKMDPPNQKYFLQSLLILFEPKGGKMGREVALFTLGSCISWLLLMPPVAASSELLFIAQSCGMKSFGNHQSSYSKSMWMCPSGTRADGLIGRRASMFRTVERQQTLGFRRDGNQIRARQRLARMQGGGGGGGGVGGGAGDSACPVPANLDQVVAKRP